MKRKLGLKNNVLFAILIILFIIIVSVFGYFISYNLGKKDNTYKVSAGTVMYDSDGEMVETLADGELSRGFDRNYYLTYTHDNSEYKHKLGSNVILYKKGDYRLFLYGTAYMIEETGEVKKVTKQTELVKTTGPYFIKVNDRRYIFVDKKLNTNDNSIQSNDYMIVNLDKQGNATFSNFEYNVKTIKPLILKGTKFNFDIANEELITSLGTTVNLKKVMGSSNNFVIDVEEKENEENTMDDYYEEYFKKLKESFNNLTNSLVGMNENLQGELAKEEAYLDLTRWTNLTSVESDVTSITLDYKVFDPNNEYSEIFVIVTKGEDSKKYQLSKTNSKYVISDLDPDTEYGISYGYRVVKAVGDDTMDIIMDNIKVATLSLNYGVSVTRITGNQINYKLSFGNKIPDSFYIELFSDGNSVGKILKTSNDIDKSGYLEGFIEVESPGYMIELQINNIIFDKKEMTYKESCKFINY